MKEKKVKRINKIQRVEKVHLKQSKKKAIIFDFDGTIANSFNFAVDIIFNITQSMNYDFKRDYIYDSIRNKDLKDLIKDYKVSKFEIFLLLFKSRRDFRKIIENVCVFDKIGDVLRDLSLNFDLILLSSNSKENINFFLKKFNLDIFFKKKYFKSSLFGKSKIINKILKKNFLNVEDVIYVGDEVRDVQACKKVGCDIIAVSYGYNSRELLKKFEPTFLVDSPQEILGLEILKNLK